MAEAETWREVVRPFVTLDFRAPAMFSVAESCIPHDLRVQLPPHPLGV